jgi:hypothetical protein
MRNIGGLISGSGVKRISDGSAFKAGGASTYTLARISGRNYPFGNYHTADSQGAIGTGGSGYGGGWMLPDSMDNYGGSEFQCFYQLLRYEDNKFLRFYTKVSGYNVYCNAVDYTPTMNESFPGVKPNVKTDQNVGPASTHVRAAELPPGGTARFIWAFKRTGTNTGWDIRTATGINSAGTLLGISSSLNVNDSEYASTVKYAGNIQLIPIDNRYVIFTRQGFHSNGTQPFYIEVIDTNPTTPVRNSRVALTQGTHYPLAYMAGWCPLQQRVYTCHSSTQTYSAGYSHPIINQFNWTGTALVRDNTQERSGTSRRVGSHDGDNAGTWASKLISHATRGAGAYGHFPKNLHYNFTTQFVGGWIWMSHGHMIAYHSNSNSFIDLGFAWTDWYDESSQGAAGMGTSYTSVANAEAQQGVLNSKIDNIYGLWDGTKSYATMQQPVDLSTGGSQFGRCAPIKLDENNWVAYGTPPSDVSNSYYVPFWFDFSKRQFNWEKGRPTRIDGSQDAPSSAGGAGNYTINANGYAGYPQRPLTGTYTTGGNTVASNGEQAAISVSMLGTYPIPTTGGSMQSSGGGHGKEMVGSEPAHLIHWGGYYRSTCIGKYDVTYDVIERK